VIAYWNELHGQIGIRREISCQFCVLVRLRDKICPGPQAPAVFPGPVNSKVRISLLTLRMIQKQVRYEHGLGSIRSGL
jgi:hypothetical protein